MWRAIRAPLVRLRLDPSPKPRELAPISRQAGRSGRVVSALLDYMAELAVESEPVSACRNP
jgi:hypothetical protein